MAGAQVLIVFETTNMALKSEGALKSARVPCTVIPTPVEITAECGIALLIGGDWVDPASEALGESGCRGYRLICPYERKRLRAVEKGKRG